MFDDFFEEVLKRGTARGLSYEQVAEVAAAEVALPPASDAIARVAAERVDEAVQFESDLRQTVEAALSNAKGWRLRNDLHVAVQPYGEVDYVIETGEGLVLIDSVFVKQAGNTVLLKSYALARKKEELGAAHSYLVVPNDARIGVAERDGTRSCGRGRDRITKRRTDSAELASHPEFANPTGRRRTRAVLTRLPSPSREVMEWRLPTEDCGR